MSDVLTDYLSAKHSLLEHVGLIPDWVEYPIDDASQDFWYVDDNTVHSADSEQELIDKDGQYYTSSIYTQRFYKKHVFRGDKYTLIFCDPHVDGCKWWRVFDNAKERKA